MSISRPTACERCHLSLEDDRPWTTSIFNTDRLCMDCKRYERHTPGYGRAVAAEERAARDGDYNFPGVGLSNEDREFLAQRRKARGAAA